MALVTEAEVKAVYETERDCVTFIETADLIVTEDLASSGLSAARLKQIELYLSAHLAAMSDGGPITGEKVGGASMSYANIYGEGLKSTAYGLQAIALDTSGILASKATAAKRAQFRVV